MSNSRLRRENEDLRKQIALTRVGSEEPRELKEDRLWRVAGEEMCGHVGIAHNPKSFRAWIKSRYEPLPVDQHPATMIGNDGVTYTFANAPTAAQALGR
jgi:hypothetical protein